MDIQLKKIKFAHDDEGNLLNPRGKVHDTTDLQDSMSLVGQLFPIQVVAENGHYLVADGQRRVIAARSLGWKSINADVVDAADLRARMLGSDTRENFKPTAKGHAIQKLACDKQWGIERVAKLCGMPVDKAQLLVDLANAPETVQRRFSTEATDLTGFPKSIQDLPPIALLDHVGSEFYTPYFFAAECAEYGPSRRVPKTVAQAVAKHVPIPIVFTNSWLPITDVHCSDDLLAWAGGIRESVTYDVTCYEEGWGLRRDDYRGERHWIIPALAAMHSAGNGKEKHLTKIMPVPLAENTLLAEQIFGISWLTRVVYIATEDDTDEALADLLKSGIEPVQLDDEENLP